MAHVLDTPELQQPFILSPGYEIIHHARWKKIQQEKLAPTNT